MLQDEKNGHVRLEHSTSENVKSKKTDILSLPCRTALRCSRETTSDTEWGQAEVCPSITSFEPAGQIRPATFAVSLSPTYSSVDRGKLTYSSQCSYQQILTILKLVTCLPIAWYIHSTTSTTLGARDFSRSRPKMCRLTPEIAAAHEKKPLVPRVYLYFSYREFTLDSDATDFHFSVRRRKERIPLV